MEVKWYANGRCQQQALDQTRFGIMHFGSRNPQRCQPETRTNAQNDKLTQKI